MTEEKLKKQLDDLEVEQGYTIVTFKALQDQYNKDTARIKQEKQTITNQLTSLSTASRLKTIAYINGVFTYNGETHVIKRERVERIMKNKNNVYNHITGNSDSIPQVVIEYKPLGTSRLNYINIPCGDEAQSDTVYQTVRKILLGV